MGEFIIECTLCGASFGCERDYDSHPCVDEDTKVPFKIKMEQDEEEAELENEAASFHKQGTVVVKTERPDESMDFDNEVDPLQLQDNDKETDDRNKELQVSQEDTGMNEGNVVEQQASNGEENEVENLDVLDPNTKINKVTDAVSVRNECGICGKRFYRREDFLNHTSNSHKIPRPFQCKICKKRFTQKHYVNLHMRVHTGEKPYKCKLCSNTYTHKTSFTIHMRIHNGDRPYVCGMCGKKCYDKSGLTSHMRSHTKETPYECEVCGRRFTHSKSLLVHRRNHTGEKPYKCQYCGKCFRHWHKHKIHIRLHTGERPYRCKVCGKGFPRNDEVKRHMRSHDGIKSFKCSICGVYCATQASITGHIDLHHADLRQINPDAPEKTVVRDSHSGILGTKAPQPRTIYKPVFQATTQTSMHSTNNDAEMTEKDDGKIQTINGEKTKVLSYKEFIELQEKLLLCKGLTVKNSQGNSTINKPVVANTEKKKKDVQANGSQGKQIMLITPQSGQKSDGLRFIMPQPLAGTGGNNKQFIMAASPNTPAQRIVLQQPSVVLPQGQMGNGQQIILLSKQGAQQNPMLLSQPLLLLSGNGNSQRMVLMPSKSGVPGSNITGGLQTLLVPSQSVSNSSTNSSSVSSQEATTSASQVVIKKEPGVHESPSQAATANNKETKTTKLPNGIVIKQEPVDDDSHTNSNNTFCNIRIKQEPQDY